MGLVTPSPRMGAPTTFREGEPSYSFLSFVFRENYLIFYLFLVDFCTTKFQPLNLPCPGLQTLTVFDLQSLLFPVPLHLPPAGSRVCPFVTVLCWGLAPRRRKIPLV